VASTVLYTALALAFEDFHRKINNDTTLQGDYKNFPLPDAGHRQDFEKVNILFKLLKFYFIYFIGKIQKFKTSTAEQVLLVDQKFPPNLISHNINI